jgi:hypothetical protein
MYIIVFGANNICQRKQIYTTLSQIANSLLQLLRSDKAAVKSTKHSTFPVGIARFTYIFYAHNGWQPTTTYSKNRKNIHYTLQEENQTSVEISRAIHDDRSPLRMETRPAVLLA